MNDPAIAVRKLLNTMGFGAIADGTAYSLYVGAPPDKPDAVTLVNVTGGLPPEARLLLNYPSVQVMVRGAASGYVAAAAKIQSAVNLLLGMTTTVVDGDTYRGCIVLSDVAYLGQDDNTRPMFSVNLRFFVEPAAVAGGHRVSI
jgi:hypothetical protein